MNYQEQRIAIAKACGWSYTSFRKAGVYTPTGQLACFYDSHGNDYDGLDWDTCFQRKLIPDYLTDLNAMHEAEKILTNVQHAAFRRWLFSDVESDHDAGEGENDERYFVSATASQRAEAFLKTLNLWNNK